MTNHKLRNFSLRMAVFHALLKIKFQSERNIESPFETQSVIMATFVICILLYATTLCTPYFPELIDDINLLAGSLATILLTFILFPGLGLVVIVIWVIFFVKLVYRAIGKFCQLYHEMSSTSDLFNRVFLGRQAHQNEERRNGSTANNNWHASLALAIGVLLSLMPLKYPQSMKPLETHSALMLILIIAVLVYATAWEIEHHPQTNNNNSSIHPIIVTKISLFSGSLVTVVLVLLIVPAIGWFILLVWTLFLMKQIYEACQMLHQLNRSISLVSYVFNEEFGPGAHLSLGRNGLVA
ncbi:hypothetical protein PVK06_036921 [Gossypium arboreum]|uniref:Uncharacterized protein n=1 Tax=Gossypium arboreum TaxID=29729 RepID=A0ABR0NN45_GOSAR|nr:hypothetical protein PVK06_036921 [Gossypium arboreum]